MRALVAGLCLLALLILAASSRTLVNAANGLLIDETGIGNSGYATDTLDPPTSLAATGGTWVTLTWTPTADTYAGGHHLLRATTSGGPYSQVAEVTPRTTSAYADTPSAGGTYYYVARAFYQGWESANSNEVAAAFSTSSQTNTGFRDCSSSAAVTSSSGDNNGFETSPSSACSDGGSSASDGNSGTNTNTSCSNTGKDRHIFYDYGLAIPAGSIDGIEVRLDARIDGGSSASRFMCVELSWDGGATWTAARTTATLTTTDATYNLGDASDTWGRTWAATDFTVANFRLRVTNVAPAPLATSTSTGSRFRSPIRRLDACRKCCWPKSHPPADPSAQRRTFSVMIRHSVIIRGIHRPGDGNHG